MVFSTIWLGLIGFLDDYIKVFRKKKEGLKGKFKIFGQVGLGIVVGLTMWFHGDIVVKDTVKSRPAQSIVLTDCTASEAATQTVEESQIDAPMIKLCDSILKDKEADAQRDKIIC